MFSISHSMLSPNLESTDPLTLLLNKQCERSVTEGASSKAYWNSNHYSLQKSDLFLSLSKEQQNEIVLRLNMWNMNLIYFIEKFGLNYGAKMILLAETTEEKSLYTIFSGDEVRHRMMVEPFLLKGIPRETSFHPLLDALARCLSEGTKEAMTFTIQVILEGFGLMHYSALRASCVDTNLAYVFDEILRDEVGHHGMGVVLSKRSQLNSKDMEQILDLTSMFVQSLIHADWVTKSVEETTGGLTKGQKSEFRDQIGWQQSQTVKINRMSQLIEKVGQKSVVANLMDRGVFSF